MSNSASIRSAAGAGAESIAKLAGELGCSSTKNQVVYGKPLAAK